VPVKQPLEPQSPGFDSRPVCLKSVNFEAHAQARSTTMLFFKELFISRGGERGTRGGAEGVGDKRPPM
jgi:hypothetical protein